MNVCNLGKEIGDKIWYDLSIRLDCGSNIFFYKFGLSITCISQIYTDLGNPFNKWVVFFNLHNTNFTWIDSFNNNIDYLIIILNYLTYN